MKKIIFIALTCILSNIIDNNIYAAYINNPNIIKDTAGNNNALKLDTLKSDQTKIDPIKIMQDKLNKKLPDLKIDSITLTPINNIYEVISGRKIFYVDQDINYMLLGDLLDLNTKTSLTETKLESLNNITWDYLPTNLAIKHVIGNGERKIAVFTDPDCPFCKQLEQNVLKKLNNITIYYFLYPLPMHLDAKNKAKKILCSANPEVAYLDWMTNGKLINVMHNAVTCDAANQLSVIEKLAKDTIGINATPTIVLSNGNLLDGVVPLDYLNQLIDDAKK